MTILWCSGHYQALLERPIRRLARCYAELTRYAATILQRSQPLWKSHRPNSCNATCPRSARSPSTRRWPGLTRVACFRELARRVAIPSESQESAAAPVLRQYLEDEMRSTFERLGLSRSSASTIRWRAAPPMMIARRRRSPAPRRTVLMYGHGDVVRGQAGQWRARRCRRIS